MHVWLGLGLEAPGWMRTIRKEFCAFVNSRILYVGWLGCVLMFPRQTEKMVPLINNIKYFISLLQKLVDLRAVEAGLQLITMKNVVNIYSRLSQISSMSCVPDSLFYCLICKKSGTVNILFLY